MAAPSADRQARAPASKNYLGFPTGISGQALTGRAFVQAQKFGAEMAIPVEVTGFDCGVSPFSLTFANGRIVKGASSGRRERSVLPAPGYSPPAGVRGPWHLVLGFSD